MHVCSSSRSSSGDAWASCSSSRRAGSILDLAGHRGGSVRECCERFTRRITRSPSLTFAATRSPGSVHHSRGRHCSPFPHLRDPGSSTGGGRRRGGCTTSPRQKARESTHAGGSRISRMASSGALNTSLVARVVAKSSPRACRRAASAEMASPICSDRSRGLQPARRRRGGTAPLHRVQGAAEARRAPRVLGLRQLARG